MKAASFLFYLALNLSFIATVNLPVNVPHRVRGPKIAPIHFISQIVPSSMPEHFDPEMIK